MRRLPDPELIALVRGGSRDAAGILFDRYWTYCWKAVFAVTGDRSAADDAAQEAMLRAFGTIDRFDESRPFGPWLKRIAVNCAIDHLRRQRRRARADSEHEALHSWDVGEAADDAVRLWAVTDAVGALSPDRRAVVVLHYWLDYPLDEIAGLLGLPVGTVASRLARARDELRDALEGADRVV